ncbi:hypothetical protein CGLO_09735 [Colletotrichum gloeosporioides Cg-14]|uniref:Uncharacterized protein n=1 Tax=Colletotrichum gloeosporioides (strain Cg-14) TaxID=1237896 RepID=T0LGQ4_COLGC|nr:hypothetical protein CGLO_09735 [Colletotrichum gloeosporioides Cg-14]
MDDGQDTPTKPISGTRAEEETGLTPARSTETAPGPGPSTPLPATPTIPTTEEQTPGTLRRLFQTPPRRPRRSRAAAGLEAQEPSPLRPLETPPRRPPKRARFTTGFGSPSSPTGSGGHYSPVLSDAEASSASNDAFIRREGVALERLRDAAVEGEDSTDTVQRGDAFVVTEAGPSGDAERKGSGGGGTLR